jgi:sterol desaturase/sphingolipid hydroxylase (fatty acid hydroxylase superfamily)
MIEAITPPPIAVAWAAGVSAWTLLEYGLHRFLGHDRRTMPNAFSVEHTRHHAEGNYFAPTWKKGLVAVAFAAVVFGLARTLVVPAVAAAFTAGLVGMYLGYEIVHRRAHTHAGIGRYGRHLRRHHFHHHFENPRMNHGITSPVWDLVFGTYERPVDIRVPRKLAMQWLCDPATGDVRPEFAGTYRLVR